MPNKATREAKAFCQSLVDDPAYQTKFMKRWRGGKLPARLEEMVWAYAFGKPKQSVEVDASQSLEALIRASYGATGPSAPSRPS